MEAGSEGASRPARKRSRRKKACFPFGEHRAAGHKSLGEVLRKDGGWEGKPQKMSTSCPLTGAKVGGPGRRTLERGKTNEGGGENKKKRGGKKTEQKNY